MEAENVRGLNPAGVTELTEQLSRAARGFSAEQAAS